MILRFIVGLGGAGDGAVVVDDGGCVDDGNDEVVVEEVELLCMIGSFGGGIVADTNETTLGVGVSVAVADYHLCFRQRQQEHRL